MQCIKLWHYIVNILDEKVHIWFFKVDSHGSFKKCHGVDNACQVAYYLANQCMMAVSIFKNILLQISNVVAQEHGGVEDIALPVGHHDCSLHPAKCSRKTIMMIESNDDSITHQILLCTAH